MRSKEIRSKDRIRSGTPAAADMGISAAYSPLPARAALIFRRTNKFRVAREFELHDALHTLERGAPLWNYLSQLQRSSQCRSFSFLYFGWCARSIRGRVVRHRPHGPLATLRLQGGKRGGLQSDGKDCSDWGLLMDAQVTVREFRELTQRLRF
jgi:hypothetical protein